MEKDLDKKLYKDYLNGEKQAFEYLYSKYKSRIEYFIYNIVKDYQKAEDLAQDTFIYVMQNKMQENSSFKYYIYLIAKSKIAMKPTFTINPNIPFPLNLITIHISINTSTPANTIITTFNTSGVISENTNLFISIS